LLEIRPVNADISEV